MKLLLNGCAAAALLLGLSGHANAQTLVRDAPVHRTPSESDVPAPPRAAEADRDVFAALGHRASDAASAYETFVRRASAIDANFADADAVQRAVKIGAAYHPQQLQEGAVAYAALLALRDPAFVEGVRARRDSGLADRLAREPDSVLDVAGADRAAAVLTGVLKRQAAALQASGKAIGQAAYDVQHQAWSSGPVSDAALVLASVKTAGSEPRSAGPEAERALLQSLASASTGDEAGSAGPPGEVVRGLALAALTVLGRAGDSHDAEVEALLNDPKSADCLKIAKLNLNQCLAAAGPHYEDVFCLGRHAIGETAQCVTAAANSGAPIQSRMASVQVAAREDYGPEQAAVYGRRDYGRADLRDDDPRATAPPPPEGRDPYIRPYREAAADPNDESSPAYHRVRAMRYADASPRYDRPYYGRPSSQYDDDEPRYRPVPRPSDRRYRYTEDDARGEGDAD